MALDMEERVETAPKVYCVDDAHLFLNWIAEGTDGYLYTVPSEPGGWSRRSAYDGHLEELKPISPQKARAIVKFVGGACKDWGAVMIAETSLTAHPEYWSTSIGSSQTTG